LGYDNWNNQFTLINLEHPEVKKVILDLKNDWTQASHVSYLVEDDAFALVSFYSAVPNPQSLYSGEIISVTTDGSARITHLVRHHSIFRNYLDTPRASISRDGKFALFTSNWGSSERRDVYILRMP
jgi:hypothetical protein